jgi:hypothetical protein
MHRYNKCKDILRERIDIKNRNSVAYLLIWLRYSFTR